MVAPFPDSQANPTHYLTTTSEVTPVYDHRKLSERATQNLQKRGEKEDIKLESRATFHYHLPATKQAIAA